MGRMPIRHRLPASLPKGCPPGSARGIRPGFPGLSPCGGQVAYALRTRAPVAGTASLPPAAPRLACIKPAASVHPEPGSNSSWYLSSCPARRASAPRVSPRKPRRERALFFLFWAGARLRPPPPRAARLHLRSLQRTPARTAGGSRRPPPRTGLQRYDLSSSRQSFSGIFFSNKSQVAGNHVVDPAPRPRHAPPPAKPRAGTYI